MIVTGWIVAGIGVVVFVMFVISLMIVGHDDV